MEASLKAGVALYNTGEYHAAHDPWEESWLTLDDGPDERLLHGLIQTTAAVYHANRGNRSGATGLARSAVGYLVEVPEDYRGLNIGEIRTFLEAVAADPTVAEDPLPLTLNAAEPDLDSLRDDFDATAKAAVALAEEYDYDESLIEDAVVCAREERGTDRTLFLSLVTEFVTNSERRGLVFQRLSGHVARERQKTEDVEGLFD